MQTSKKWEKGKNVVDKAKLYTYNIHTTSYIDRVKPRRAMWRKQMEV